MAEQKILKIILLFVFAFSMAPVFSQHSYQLQLTKTPVACDKGSASLALTGADDATVSITWSSDQSHATAVRELISGHYSVAVEILSMDTVLHKTDTTLYFTIDSEECPVYITNQFTPNGDDYNDLFTIGNVTNYPNFELEIFDRWGQRVHHQKGSFTPWDGRWSGAPVPDGTYYYIFFFDAQQKNKFRKGDLTILR